MNTVSIVHNPRCSKSRGALQILRDKGIEPEIIDYMTQAPDETAIQHWLDLLVPEPRQLMRQDEDEYRALGLNDPKLSHADLIHAMIRHPRLIQRPIVISAGRAVIARPPERVLEIL